MGAGPMSGQDVRGGADRFAWVSGLEPATVWREFAGLAALPRPSKGEGLVRAHVLDRLGELGLVARADRVGNVVADCSGAIGGGDRRRRQIQWLPLRH